MDPSSDRLTRVFFGAAPELASPSSSCSIQVSGAADQDLASRNAAEGADKPKLQGGAS